MHICVYVCIYTRIHAWFGCMYVYVGVRVCMYMGRLCCQEDERGWMMSRMSLGAVSMCVYVCIHECMYVCICEYVCLCVCVYAIVYVCVCVCTWVDSAVNKTSMWVDDVENVAGSSECVCVCMYS